MDGMTDREQTQTDKARAARTLVGRLQPRRSTGAFPSVRLSPQPTTAKGTDLTRRVNYARKPINLHTLHATPTPEQTRQHAARFCFPTHFGTTSRACAASACMCNIVTHIAFCTHPSMPRQPAEHAGRTTMAFNSVRAALQALPKQPRAH